MTRARILADYVSSGDELALKAPLAGPTFTGTVAIPNVANLETAVVANTAKVTNYNQTLADINALDITELGTVTSANLSNSAIVYPAGHMVFIDSFIIAGGTSGTASSPTDTGLTLAIPSATVAKYSKLIISVRNYFRIQPGSSTCTINLKIIRTVPSESDVEINLTRYGNDTTNGPIFGAMFETFTDENLLTGIHTYKTQYWRDASTTAGTLYFLGESGTMDNEIIAIGVV